VSALKGSDDGWLGQALRRQIPYAFVIPLAALVLRHRGHSWKEAAFYAAVVGSCVAGLVPVPGQRRWSSVGLLGRLAFLGLVAIVWWVDRTSDGERGEGGWTILLWPLFVLAFLASFAGWLAETFDLDRRR
jgi:hypothetical protein